MYGIINSMSKRLYRSTTNKMIAGVCSGIAEYFDADPTIIRLVAVILLITTGPLAVVAYIAAAIIVPEKGKENPDGKEN